jgi:hypothetical protein
VNATGTRAPLVDWARPRDFHAHIALYAAYAGRVTALPPEAWARLEVVCASIDGDEITAVVDRARLAARAHNFLDRFATKDRVAGRIGALTTALITGIGVVTELVSEFEGPPSKQPGQRARPTGAPPPADPDTTAYVDAWSAIEQAVAPVATRHPGVATAVRAAGQAVLRHDWLSRETFDAVYRFVEAEIPYASIDRWIGDLQAANVTATAT